MVFMGGGVEVGLSLRGFGRAACLVLRFLPRCPSGISPGAPYERLADSERELSHALVPVGAVLRDARPHGLGQRNTESLEVAPERPAVGHLLAPDVARRPYSRQHGPLRGAALEHARDVL